MPKLSVKTKIAAVVVATLLLGAAVTTLTGQIRDDGPHGPPSIIATGEYFAAEGLHQVQSRVFLLSGVVSEVTIEGVDLFREVVAKAANDNKRVLLEINSPGGSVDVSENLMAVFEDYGNIDTLIAGEAASAAAQIWINGTSRYMRNSATLLFHGVSAGGQTIGDLVRLRDLLQDPRWDEISSSKPADSKALIEKLQSELTLAEAVLLAGAGSVAGIAVHINQARRHSIGMVDVVGDSNDRSVDSVYETLSRENPGVTREFVVREVFKDYAQDGFLTKKEAIALGLVKDTGLPDFKSYMDSK